MRDSVEGTAAEQRSLDRSQSRSRLPLRRCERSQRDALVVRFGERESSDEVGERRVKDTGDVELESGDDVGGESVNERASGAEGIGIGIVGDMVREVSESGLDDRAIIAIGD